MRLIHVLLKDPRSSECTIHRIPCHKEFLIHRKVRGRIGADFLFSETLSSREIRKQGPTRK